MSSATEAVIPFLWMTVLKNFSNGIWSFYDIAYSAYEERH